MIERTIGKKEEESFCAEKLKVENEVIQSVLKEVEIQIGKGIMVEELKGRKRNEKEKIFLERNKIEG